ncbi:MAG: xanthine dehydrogenase family protein molybdopterin-binding subunit, partial [Caulobacteraceae bacterium]
MAAPETLAPQTLADPSRRNLLLAGGGFTLAFTLMRGGRAEAIISARPQSSDAAAAAADGHPAFAPNAFIRIDRTGPIRLVMPSVEMGQGIYTGASTLIAEELDVGLDQLSLEHAPPNAQLYASPVLQQQATGGSTSIRGDWKVMREAGAVARVMLVGAAAQTWGVDPASCTVERGVVHHAASGRSASYGDLAQAAARQPVPPKVTLKDPKDFKLIGKPLRRLDTAGKVDGSVVYGIDATAPGMKIAAYVPCPVYGGKLKSVDDSRARAIPGVREVVRLENGVGVIGDHFWAAKTGAEALQVEWDLGPLADFSTAGLLKAMDDTSLNGKALVARQAGDLDHGGHRIEAIYQSPFLAHAPMEPMNALVHVRPDACEIWVGTQVPTRVVDVAAKITGLPKDKIIVHNHYLGGGFGRRLDADSVVPAVSIAKAVGYPVKMIWTRENDIQHDIPRPYYYDRISAVLDGDGLPIVWTDRVTSDSVARRWAPVILRKDGFDSDTTEGAAETPYALKNVKVEWAPHHLPGDMPVAWWRGVGPTHNLFKVESFIDECAHAAGKDPVAYRRALLHDNPRALGVLNLAAEKMGWGASPTGERVGRGIALGAPFGSYVCTALEIEVSPQGEIRLRRSVTAIDCGIAINPNTIEAQIQGGLVFGWTAALYSQITHQNGVVQQSNFHDYRMMRMNETPRFEVHIVPSGETPGGMGEVGTAIAAPVLGNAIFAATGVRIRTLPVNRDLLVQDDGARKAVLTAAPLGALA